MRRYWPYGVSAALRLDDYEGMVCQTAAIEAFPTFDSSTARPERGGSNRKLYRLGAFWTSWLQQESVAFLTFPKAVIFHKFNISYRAATYIEQVDNGAAVPRKVGSREYSCNIVCITFACRNFSCSSEEGCNMTMGLPILIAETVAQTERHDGTSLRQVNAKIILRVVL